MTDSRDDSVAAMAPTGDIDGGMGAPVEGGDGNVLGSETNGVEDNNDADNIAGGDDGTAATAAANDEEPPKKKRKSRKNDYRNSLIRFINFLDDTDLPKQAVDDGRVSQERLGRITPADVMRWFNFITFGVEDPGTGFGDMKPQVRCNSIEYLKKAVSFYMPNRFAWNVLANAGNPTQAKVVHDLIKYVKKKEARKEGAVSKARRSITMSEILFLYQLLRQRTSGTPLRNYIYGIPAMCNFQLHMIARIDDCCMATLESLQGVEAYPFLLKTRLFWSKNVMEERDAPWQFVLASMDAKFDVHCSLGLWLENYFEEYPPGEDTPYLFPFQEDMSIPEGGEKNKEKVQGILRIYFGCDEFIAFASRKGPLGSHSFRKRSSTNARLNGAQKDEKDYRGRWKAGRRVSDAYDDVELPFIDAKVAAALCPGGACKYIVKENSGVTDAFILQYVTPKIATILDNSVALVLGRAVLWYVYATEEGLGPVPSVLEDRIRNNINLPDGMENPIKKVQYTVSGNDAEVHFNEVEDFEQEQEQEQEPTGAPQPPPPAAAAPTTAAPAANANTVVTPPVTPVTQTFTGSGNMSNMKVRDQIGVLHLQQRQLYNQNLQIMRMMKEQDKQRKSEHLKVNRNVQRIALQPARRIGIGNPNPTIQQTIQQLGHAQEQQAAQQQQPIQHGPPAKLAKVKNLYELWHEYEFGNDGNKAAKYFTSAERGTVKHKYTRRKVVWDCVLRQIARGVSYNVAIDRIYTVYGHDKSVTKIINELRTDIKNKTLHISLK